MEGKVDESPIIVGISGDNSSCVFRRQNNFNSIKMDLYYPYSGSIRSRGISVNQPGRSMGSFFITDEPLYGFVCGVFGVAWCSHVDPIEPSLAAADRHGNAPPGIEYGEVIALESSACVFCGEPFMDCLTVFDQRICHRCEERLIKLSPQDSDYEGWIAAIRKLWESKIPSI
jgi:hypothetical protein